MNSEDVLLIVNQVWHKKSPGSLYLMNTRAAWMPGSRNTFQISHNYADIKSQKISPDSKEKVQLQLVMHDGGANTFHFRNTKGRPACVEDREQIKSRLVELLPKFRSKINSELEEKHRMLQENAQLFQLYNDLVVSGIMSAEEFWANRTSGSKSQPARQEVGVSADVLSEVKPQVDGANNLKYNLTADIMDSIFRTYPSVRAKHAQHVPHDLSESEFWTRFFQSHYFHRDRINVGTKDLFSECAKDDERDIQEEISKRVGTSSIDLTQFTDGPTLGEEFLDKPGAPAQQVNKSIIRRFNHHSTMVLKSCESLQASLKRPGDPPETVNSKQPKLVQYEDLEEEPSRGNSQLSLLRLDNYFHGPTPMTTVPYHSTDDMIAATGRLHKEMSTWRPNLTQCLAPKSALDVLNKLSPGGALMQSTGQHRVQDCVSDELNAEIRNLYTAIEELLRHFWTCFPVKSPALEEKLTKMNANLLRFQETKLQPFVQKTRMSSYSLGITDHLEQMVQVALTKFHTWQSKKR